VKDHTPATEPIRIQHGVRVSIWCWIGLVEPESFGIEVLKERRCDRPPCAFSLLECAGFAF
jgi:hypothetical protein